MSGSDEIRFCPRCYGRLYLAFTTPTKWVHMSTDTGKCEDYYFHRTGRANSPAGVRP